MAKLGNESTLILKVLEERADKEQARIQKDISDKQYARGRVEGMEFILGQFHAIAMDLERGR